jgi:vancomycin resistance protein YoaR
MHFSKKTTFLLILCLLWAKNSSAQECELGTYSTKYASWGEESPRSHNVGLAASKINEFVLQPGEVFSYNALVGPRTLKAGFKKAHVILKGKLVDGIGGGACQVASTTHAAALISGLEIVEAHAHSLASAYIQPSLDATVVYPALDLKLKNPYTIPVKIRTVITPAPEKGKNILTVSFLANDCSQVRTVNLSFFTKITKKRYTVVLQTAKVKKGSIVKQSGSDGKIVTRNIEVYAPNGDLISNQTRVFTFVPLERIIWKAYEEVTN